MQDVIINRNQLMDYFLNSCTREKDAKIGIEFEKLGVFQDSGEAIPYTNKIGIARVLCELSQKYGWEIVREENNIIGLSKGSKSITLEPGGQVELSGSPLDSIHQVKAEAEAYSKELNHVSEFLGIKWIGLGVQPVSKLEEIQWVPKKRYKIMVPYMKEQGKLSHHMMKKTASIHVSLDYADEDDFSIKMRAALKLIPFTSAIFANSPVSEGRLNGFLSERMHIWNYTDPLRCGLISNHFFLNPCFSAYIDYALQVPMLFIKRYNHWIETKNLSFITYLEKGYQGHQATFDDWELHLSTIFTHVRARRYIEIRNIDCQRIELFPAVCALWKGILYSKNSLEQILFLLKDISWDELQRLSLTIPRAGLRLKIGKVRLLDLAKEILNIAWSGLKEQTSTNALGEDESMYLASVMQLIVEDELCPAEVIIKNWQGSWRGSIDRLVEYASR